MYLYMYLYLYLYLYVLYVFFMYIFVYIIWVFAIFPDMRTISLTMITACYTSPNYSNIIDKHFGFRTDLHAVPLSSEFPKI